MWINYTTITTYTHRKGFIIAFTTFVIFLCGYPEFCPMVWWFSLHFFGSMFGPPKMETKAFQVCTTLVQAFSWICYLLIIHALFIHQLLLLYSKPKKIEQLLFIIFVGFCLSIFLGVLTIYIHGFVCKWNNPKSHDFLNQRAFWDILHLWTWHIFIHTLYIHTHNIDTWR